MRRHSLYGSFKILHQTYPEKEGHTYANKKTNTHTHRCIFIQNCLSSKIPCKKFEHCTGYRNCSHTSWIIMDLPTFYQSPCIGIAETARLHTREINPAGFFSSVLQKRFEQVQAKFVGMSHLYENLVFGPRCFYWKLIYTHMPPRCFYWKLIYTHMFEGLSIGTTCWFTCSVSILSALDFSINILHCVILVLITQFSNVSSPKGSLYVLGCAWEGHENQTYLYKGPIVG